MSLTDVWVFLNGIKKQTVECLPKDRWAEVKEACDDRMRQASDGTYQICPAWWIGGFHG